MIQSRVGTQVVEGAARPGLGISRPEHHPAHPGGHQPSGAHRAWLQGHHHGYVGQSPPTQCRGGVGEDEEFGVGSRVAFQLALIVASRYHPTIDQSHRTHRDVVVSFGHLRLGQSHPHGGIIVESPCWPVDPHVAEAVGFEPTVSFPTHDFQSCRFGRSRTPPVGTPRQGSRFPKRRRVQPRQATPPPLTPIDGCGTVRAHRALRFPRSRRSVRRPGPAQRSPVNRVRVGRQQLSAGQAVSRSQPGRRTERRGLSGPSPDRLPDVAALRDDTGDVTPEDTPYQSLYRRFRPSTFAEVKGQDHVVLALRNAVRDGRVAHAYLFSGPRGTGKTSTARILAKALNCTDLQDGEPCGLCSSCLEITKGTSLDVHELDAASNNGVEAMRDLVSRAALGTPGRQKVYIVDEVHMLSTAASNALLKTLEEPPAHVVFVLATTDPQKVMPTIRSRTQHFEFRLLGPETLGELLAQVRQDAHLDVPDEALDLAVRRGRGSARDAFSLLDQAAASDAVDDDLPELDEVVEALAERDITRALGAVAHLTSAGFSPQQWTGDLVDHLRQGFLALVAPGLVTVFGAEQESLAAQAERVGLAALVRALEVLGRAQVTMRDAPDPRVNLDVALVRLAHPEADDSPESILARIERLEAAVRAAPVTLSAPSAPPPSPHSRPPAAGPRPAPPQPHPARAAGRHEAGPRPSAAGGPGVREPPPGTTASSPKTLGAVRRQSAPARAEATPVPPPAAPVPPPVRDEPTPTAPAAPLATVPFPTRDQLVQSWGC